jgi:hypothetical protein
MFDNQHMALEYALASRPRGLKIGDEVCYADRTFTVFALQQWALAKGACAVGLVWKGTCANCRDEWYQLTETRASYLAEECGVCDLAGVPAPTHDVLVGENIMHEVPAAAKPQPAPVEERYGSNELHILDVIKRDYVDAESANEALFVAHCASLLPVPREGIRDQRLYLTRRALQSLVKRKNAQVAVEHGRVIFCM